MEVAGAEGVQFRFDLVDLDQGFICTTMGVKTAFQSVPSAVVTCTCWQWEVGLVWVWRMYSVRHC